MGNLRSVEKAFHRLGIPCLISSDKDHISKASKLILPGVGHFAKGMEELKRLDLVGPIEEKVFNSKTPILGICLGMQLLTSFSEEGGVSGLNWIDARTVRFPAGNTKYRVPHIGWNTLELEQESPLFASVEQTHGFYFVHSYYVETNDQSVVAAQTEYGVEFVSSVCKENIYGVQFHPEKSHSAGLSILRNFAQLT